MLQNDFRNIGFIGLGAMGQEMCKRLLLLPNDIYVFDISEQAVDRLNQMGAMKAKSPADIAEKCDIILSSLPNNKVVETVFFGQQGLSSSIREGHIFIDLSSSTPATSEKIGKIMNSKGGTMLDAPVSRGTLAASEGTLSIMVGGEEKIIEESMFILRQLGTDIIHTGKLGSAHMIKSLNNLLSATNLIIALEGLCLAKKAGVDTKKFTEAINNSSGSSHMTTVRFSRYYLTRSFTSNFSLGLMYKDLSIALQVARSNGIPMFLSSLTQDIYSLAMSKGWDTEDNARIMEIVEELMDNEPSYKLQNI